MYYASRNTMPACIRWEELSPGVQGVKWSTVWTEEEPRGAFT